MLDDHGEVRHATLVRTKIDVSGRPMVSLKFTDPSLVDEDNPLQELHAGKVRLFHGSMSSDVFGFPVLAKGAYVKGYVLDQHLPLTCIVVETRNGETIEESIVVQCYGKYQPITLNRIVSLANTGDTVAFVLP